MTPTRRKPRRHDTQLAFEALSIEGGLLPPEWLARVARLDAGMQTEADYRVPRGLNLRDEIGRYWRVAQAHWSDFSSGRVQGAEAGALSARFVVDLLREAFGFVTLLPTAPVQLADRFFSVGHLALSGRLPVVIAPAAAGLDTLSPAFADGGRRRSAFGLCQEFLNAADHALSGLCSDGLNLRLLRDNASLTRPTWIEADLSRIFVEERYADFAALWLLIHESRFGRPEQPAADSPLEAWRAAGRDEGTRARAELREGVEEALLSLGNGFLAHPDNGALRTALQTGALRDRDFFAQLLRLVYRLIFLLTVEERDLLHPASTSPAVRDLYARGYSLRRLSDRSARRSAHDRHSDAWLGLTIVLRGLSSGEDRLGLPALAGLFDPSQCPNLDGSSLENRAFFLALFRLTWLRESGALSRVNWRDMGPEELGSVYESLLELVPRVSLTTRSFSFAEGEDSKAHARKKSGSYYTPERLVQHLLDSALEPVIRETIAAHPTDAAEAILSLAIVDPTCGSGHFLLGVARRLAGHVARIRANGTPSATEYRQSLREVVGRCIYGVDLNPMAVELCKVALWMEALQPGLPLGFLDAHIRHGNALLGATPDRIADGIPESAWDAAEGDDKAIAKALKKRHKTGQISLFGGGAGKAIEAPDTQTFESQDDRTLDGLARKESAWRKWLEDSEEARLIADVWCSAFVWPKQPGEADHSAPVRPLWASIRANPASTPEPTRRITRGLREAYHFFHWHLAFPKVFARGGFDVVLGNPPYLNQLESNTTVGRGVARLLDARFGEVKQTYTDLATLFMVEAQAILRPGGRQALVHPLAVFAAQDAGAARKKLATNGSISAIWITTEHIFASASVFVGAMSIIKGGQRLLQTERSRGNNFEKADSIPLSMDELAAEPTWGELIADLTGVPRVRLPGTSRLSDLAATTADFRDQFYGLSPFILDETPEIADDATYPPLIVTGLIDPATSLWGQRSCKFNKKKYARPRVDLVALRADGLLADWSRGRLVPKIVVATQTRVVEAFADPDGKVINTVPSITVTPKRKEDIWKLLAVLLAPPVSAWALGRYAGTAMSISAIKMSADQVGQVPLPRNEAPWVGAAVLVQRATEAATEEERSELLCAAAAEMCDAYGVVREPVLSWWRERYGASAIEEEEG